MKSYENCCARCFELKNDLLTNYTKEQHDKICFEYKQHINAVQIERQYYNYYKEEMRLFEDEEKRIFSFDWG